MIEQLIKEEKELLAKVYENKRKQKEYYTDLFCKEYKIKIGDTVKYKDRGEFKTGVISRFIYSGVKPYCLMVSLFNKDGTVGKRERRIWSFEIIE